MKPHPPPHRIRKTIKWGGAAVTVLLVVVWIGSGRYGYDWYPGNYIHAELIDGRFQLTKWPDTLEIEMYEAMKSRASGYRRSLGLEWGFKIGGSARHSSWRIFIPLWAFVLLAIPPVLAAWRLDALARRRERAYLCPKCGYDRTGILQDAKCPECGSSPA